MKILAIVISLVLISYGTLLAQDQAQGHDKGKNELATQFAKVLGLDKMLEVVKQKASDSSKKQIAQMTIQFKRAFPNVPPEVMKEVSRAAIQFQQKVSNSWNVQEATRIYTKALADTLPEAELKTSIAHYSTSEGQDQLKAINDAASKLYTYVGSRVQNETAKQTREFIAVLKDKIQRARSNPQPPVDPQP